MELEQLRIRLIERLQHPLPGAAAHEPLRATPVGSVFPDFTHKLPPKPGSVLIALYPKNGSIWFPLIKRPEYVGAHSGQISLPGGKAETGEGTVDTALREGEEEIGVSRADIDVVGTLSEFFVIPSNFKVTPVVGIMTSEPVFKPDAREVARIIQCDMASLVDTDAVHHKEIVAAGQFRMMAPHFEIEHEVVWGATAMILGEFREVLREILGID
jgi:8-oxo-dGTP pyrophosphatase MutT (NUDIX family)